LKLRWHGDGNAATINGISYDKAENPSRAGPIKG